MKKKVVYILLIFIVIVCLVIYFQNRLEKKKLQTKTNSIKSEKTLKSSDEVSTLNFNNQEEKTKEGDNISLHANIIPNGKKISATELHITYDPKIVKLEKIDPSENFSLVLAGSIINNEKGEASIVLGVKPGNSAIEKQTEIASFDFKLLTAGVTKIGFSDNSVAAAENVPDNVVANRNGILVIIE